MKSVLFAAIASLLAPTPAFPQTTAKFRIRGRATPQLFAAQSGPATVVIETCASGLKSGLAVEVSAYQPDGKTLIDDLYVLGNQCSSVFRVFEIGQVVKARLVRPNPTGGPTRPARKSDMGMLSLNVTFGMQASVTVAPTGSGERAREVPTGVATLLEDASRCPAGQVVVGFGTGVKNKDVWVWCAPLAVTPVK